MGTFLLGLALGGNHAWVFASLRRDGYWREFNARRRGSNPPPPGRKPAPPAGPPAPGMRREWLWSPSQMAECGGPCWEAQDPRRCDCGALWRDVPARHRPWIDNWKDEQVYGNGGPTTPKPPAKPQPHGERLIKSWEEPLPPSEP